MYAVCTSHTLLKQPGCMCTISVDLMKSGSVTSNHFSRYVSVCDNLPMSDQIGAKIWCSVGVGSGRRGRQWTAWHWQYRMEWCWIVWRHSSNHWLIYIRRPVWRRRIHLKLSRWHVITTVKCTLWLNASENLVQWAMHFTGPKQEI